ncbi:MAG: hypothetical protein IJ874_09240 [Ruminococcus sp.]|nr:hypothetical protein [Ruminococcus sp.]
MTEQEMKHWLKRAFYASKRIKVLESLIQQCRERSQGLSRTGQHNDRGKSDTAKNGTEDALMKLASLIEQYEQEKASLVGIYKEISDTIALLEDDDLQSVLESRYLLFRTVEQTAEDMHYHPRTVRYKQKKAIEKLCRIFPCFASFDVLQ